jgi:hypothetical protein
MKKFITLLLVFSIINIGCATISQDHAKIAPQKKGADLTIQKADGTQIRGWLIAVKENSLLLMERDSGADVTVDVKDVGVIKIGRKSKLLKVIGIGIASCIVGIYGTIIWADVFGPPELAEQGPIAFGLAAWLIGTIAGASLVKKNKTIKIEGKSDSEIQEILEKLRKKARIKNF